MRAGLVYDGFKIQDEIFGLYPARESCNLRETKCKRGQIYRHFDLNPGETVESIIYGRYSGFRDLPCGLSFQTNTRKIGPFSSSYPCPPIYRVDIPPEKPLGVFFKEDARTRKRENEKFVFDGFKSEYRIETEK